MKELAASQPNGLSVGMFSCVGQFVFTDVMYANIIKINPMDLTLIANVGKSPLAFVANSNSKINTVPELINLVRGGNNVNFATGGSAHQLAFEYFMDKVGGNRNTVVAANYKGPMPAVSDVAAGIVEFGIVPIAVARPLLESGKIKIIGIAGEQKLKNIPNNIPLMNSYVSGLNVYGCWNIVLPAKTPSDVQKWYVDNVTPVLNSSDYQKFMEDNLIFLIKLETTPDGVTKDMTNLRKQWQPYVKTLTAD
jgi:tripartite-type tricarboxylate transporter receptor subunit TctC